MATDVIELLKLTGALIAFRVAYARYVKAQECKRAQFIGKQWHQFESNAKVWNAMVMLDGRKVQLFKELENGDRWWFEVDDQLIEQALLKQGDYSEEMMAILDSFDAFFDGVQRFGSLIESGLIKPKQLDPFLGHWIDIIGDERNDRKGSETREAIWTYIDKNSYRGIQRLFDTYGRPITSDRITHNNRSVVIPNP